MRFSENQNNIHLNSQKTGEIVDLTARYDAIKDGY